jgi:hypothetical protein
MRWIVVAAAVFGLAWYLGYLPDAVDPMRLVSDRAECDPSYPTVCISPHWRIGGGKRASPAGAWNTTRSPS